MFDLNAIFEEMSEAISETCRSNKSNCATSKAEHIGMTLEGDRSPFKQKYDYIASNSQSDYVRFHFRYYDQSQAFSIRPDMNKFELKLILGGREARIQYASYED